MMKKIIIFVVTILLLTLKLSGCLEDDNKNNTKSNLFIGEWETTIYYFDENGTRHDEKPSNSTFYNNGTMGSESVENNKIIWTPFEIENNQICFGEVNDPEYLCYYYEFLEEGKQATLWTYVPNPYSDYDEGAYELYIEMTKI
jgi:hypothetical protein